MTVAVIVPVRDQLDHTKNLAACLAQQTTPPARVIVLDDGSRRQTKLWLRQQKGWEREDTDGLTIYEAWNRGFWLAGRGLPCEHVLIVNNDVLLPPHALAWMSRCLDEDELRCAAYPDFAAPWSAEPKPLPGKPLAVHLTKGVWGSNGMLGFCFMLHRERVTWRPLVQDLAYGWWFGDNCLAESIEVAGLQQAKVLGLPIRHVQEATARDYDLVTVKERDAQLWAGRRNIRSPHRVNRGSRQVARRDWRATRPS